MTPASSLDAEHHELSRQLEGILAACQDGRWADYRLRFAALRESLAQHMAHEEEELFPLLERRARTEVAALREAHERLRQHLDTIAAAAPERDPEGCMDELGRLGALMLAHHAAEQALDPEYARRPGPGVALQSSAALDLRGLQPPEPIVRIFEFLERGPGAPLRVILPHEPAPLYRLLREQGYSYSGSPRSDGGYELLIDRS